MQIIGITGAIGAGKSTLSKSLKKEGIPVHSADAEIHRLMREDLEVRQKIKTKWPDVLSDNHVDRIKLRNLVLKSPQELSALEEILYPKLIENQKIFLEEKLKQKKSIVGIDVPLLIETGLDRYCHYVIVAIAPHFLRKQRVLKRMGMDEKHFIAFEAHQMTDVERKKQADFVVPCGLDKGQALKNVRSIINEILKRPSQKWDGKWPKTLKRIKYGTRNRIRYRNNRA